MREISITNLPYNQMILCVHDRCRCSTETQSDYVEISNFNVHMSDRKLGRMCGRNWRRGMFMSDNNFFRVTFKSNNVYDATGFSAFYQFRTNDNSQFHTSHRSGIA